MLSRWLPFEEPLMELEEQITELERLQATQNLDLSAQIASIKQRHDDLLRKIFSHLTPWDKVLLARHPKRPYALDFINATCSHFVELHGDRAFGDDGAIVAGLAKFEGRSVVVVAQQKGRDPRERQQRNFGMPRAEGLRKAKRLMELADKFGKPVLSFVDTPGAACLVEAEERGISEAIARNQMTMSLLRAPIVVIIIGEGNSGGAIALAVGDKVLMLEHAYYSVISPEGCASILWRDGKKGPEAAAALQITSEDAYRLGIVDEIVLEPLGGAHRDPNAVYQAVKESTLNALAELEQFSPEELVERRYQRFRRLGVYQEGGSTDGAEPSSA